MFGLAQLVWERRLACEMGESHCYCWWDDCKPCCRCGWDEEQECSG